MFPTFRVSRSSLSLSDFFLVRVLRSLSVVQVGEREKDRDFGLNATKERGREGGKEGRRGDQKQKEKEKEKERKEKKVTK